ncbi:hypothetical protein [Neorhizobium galegae]|uniref:hypothetical protein n=1 Tax=Neorhizobium galegae TaxID=399 RepID=UPI0006210B04|nr:hypothetical protein [Neorhizobium galegae]KAB1122245.1 hypothetical protein F4V90_20410 [Neorhizobium galegae]MCQ1805810.1 hypothetical protein [Neorhizobium galegae]CDZ58106.1 Hypothetical protein NGAL_HAMBI2566_26630 [Neorhizobium galegae bv. orientalis]
MLEVTSSSGSFFRVVIPPIGPDGRRPRYIEFQPVPYAKIPGNVAALQIEIERALTTLIMLFPESSPENVIHEKYGVYFDKLAGIAIAGIGQDQTMLGGMALDTLKQEVVTRESGRVKNDYLKRLGVWAGAFGVLFGALSILGIYEFYPPWFADQRGFFTLLCGSMVGAWLSFSIRKVELRFSELSILENDRLDPPLRLLFVAGLTLVVGLIFSTNLASITIGGLSTTFLAASSSALLIGIFCGISEQSLATTVGSKANDFMGLLAKSASPAPQESVRTGFEPSIIEGSSNFSDRQDDRDKPSKTG